MKTPAIADPTITAPERRYKTLEARWDTALEKAAATPQHAIRVSDTHYTVKSSNGKDKYNLTWNPHVQEWECDCPAVGPCYHLATLQRRFDREYLRNRPRLHDLEPSTHEWLDGDEIEPELVAPVAPVPAKPRKRLEDYFND